MAVKPGERIMMRTDLPVRSRLAHGHQRRTAASLLAALAAVAFLAALPLGATEQPAPKSAATHKTVRAHGKKATAATPAVTPEPAPPPPAPKPPDWPANEHPADAVVVWNSQGLSIQASNSSLTQILKEVATATGAKVEGLSKDQRIFGTYGPGTARDVLAKLLEGSGYNMLLIGDQGQGTPREILLSNKPTGHAAPSLNNQPASNDDTAEADEPPQPEQPEQPQQPPNVRNGFAPGAPPRTPQQIMQEMQQRQQQTQEPAPNSPQ
jgi:hypothetical protein